MRTCCWSSSTESKNGVYVGIISGTIKNKRKTLKRASEPHLLPRLDSPVEKVVGVLLMKLLVPSLEIKRLSGFGLLDEKGLSAFGMLIEGSGQHRGEPF